MGGVLLRTEDGTPREELAAVWTNRRALERLVFASPSAEQAMRGEIPVEEHWTAVGRSLALSAAEMIDFQKAFWAGDRIDDRLMYAIRACGKIPDSVIKQCMVEYARDRCDTISI
jgi:hypothetical protein